MPAEFPPIIPVVHSDLSSRIAAQLPHFLTHNPLYHNINTRAFFFGVGACLAIYKTISYTKAILQPFFQVGKDLSIRYGKNTWAVITGSSDGIGKAYAFELAKRGFNIVLVGRNEEKLTGVERELKWEHPQVETKIVVADFSKCYEPGWAEAIYDQVKDLDITILVNNAGVAKNTHFHALDLKIITDMVLVNALAQALVTRVFLPKLAKRVGRSAIINTSSLAASCPRGYAQVYASTKRFHDYLARSVSYEHRNVDVLSVKPGLVSTKMTGYKKKDFRTILPEEFVKESLKFLGSKTHTYGHWKHQFDAYVISWWPECLRGWYFKGRYHVQD